jgi:hypothetical protein
MRCKICEEIEGALRSAQRPDGSAETLGLSPAGERNRTNQRGERIKDLQAKLVRHRSKTCPDRTLADVIVH